MTEIIVFFLYIALINGIETSIKSINIIEIELQKKQGNFIAFLISLLLQKQTKLLLSLTILKYLALVACYYLIVSKASQFPISDNYLKAIWYIFVILLTWLFLFVFSYLIPKALFGKFASPFLKILIIPVYILHALLFILTYLFSIIINKFENKNKFSTQQESLFFANSSNQSLENEELNQNSELIILQNVLDFKEVKIRECMQPRTEIIGIELQQSIQELKNLFVETGHSKLLIYQNSIDTIIGYVHCKDLFNKPKTIKSILRSIILVPETLQATTLLRKLIKKNQSIAVVLDEFGGTSGIITLEDLMEEIFGEIEDEFDTDDLLEEQIDEKNYLLSARFEIDYLNDKYGFKIPISTEYETLAGYIILQHKSIPTKGEIVKIDSFEFEILHAKQTKINTVKMRLLV